MEKLILLSKGAEANILLNPDWNGIKVIIKRREPKKYRLPELDAIIRRTRTAREALIINRAKEIGVPTPLIYQINNEHAQIIMEYIKGEKVRDLVEKINSKERIDLFTEIGKKAGLLHNAGITHGDLTTSNIISREGTPIFIDFGLAEMSEDVESRGVDLNLMYRMLISTHYKYTEELFRAFLDGYQETLEDAQESIDRMDTISKRGRYIVRE